MYYTSPRHSQSTDTAISVSTGRDCWKVLFPSIRRGVRGSGCVRAVRAFVACVCAEQCRGVIYCGGLVFLFRLYDVGGSRLGGVEMPIGDVVLCHRIVRWVPLTNQIFTVKSVIRRRRGERGCVGDGVDVCDKVCDPPQLYGAPAASDQHCEEADVIGSPTPPSCTPQSPLLPTRPRVIF